MIKKTAGQHGAGMALVLLHGFSGSRSSWQPLADHISWDGPILIPDLSGSGSEAWPESRDANAITSHSAQLDATLSFGNSPNLGIGITEGHSGASMETTRSRFDTGMATTGSRSDAGSGATGSLSDSGMGTTESHPAAGTGDTVTRSDARMETAGNRSDAGIGITERQSDRGLGATESRSETGIGIMACALEVWLDAQGVGSFVVVGHSMGGYVALELLKRIPDRIAGLGLFHSHPLADDDDKRANRRRTLNLIRDAGHTRFMDAFVPSLFAPESVEPCSERIKQLRAVASSQLPQHICHQIEAMMNRSDRLNLLLEHSSLPKWVVLGEQDPVLPLARAWDWISRLDNLQLDILPNTGHMGMEECPDRCLKLFEEFNEFVNRSQHSKD